MAAVLKNTRLGLSFQSLRQFIIDAGSVDQEMASVLSKTLASGTGTSEADLVWMDTRTVNSGANDDLNLTDLDLTDTSSTVVEAGLNFAIVKAILIISENAAGGSGNMTLGNATTAFDGAGTPFVSAGSTSDVMPGGFFFWYSPVGASTSGANELRVAGVTANQTYRVAILGESA